MATPAETPFQVRPLGAADADAWLHFFDHEAFSDNPRWAGCYCQYPTVDHDAERWQDRSAAANRARACERLAHGQQRGVVALAQGRVIGWCHAGPWREARIMDDAPEPLAERLGAITCFVVGPGWRGRGVARALLGGACDLLRSQGCVAVDAWARPDAADPAALHTGPLALLQEAGFQKLREVKGARLMRCSLASAA